MSSGNLTTKLLAANFGDGKINAFDINSSNFIAPLKNRRGEPLDFNGLWALFFLDDRLYFTTGIGDESHGLFGVNQISRERKGRRFARIVALTT